MWYELEQVNRKGRGNGICNASALRFCQSGVVITAGVTEFRYAAVFEGSSLKRLLAEVCDLVFDRSNVRGYNKQLDLPCADERCRAGA